VGWNIGGGQGNSVLGWTWLSQSAIPGTDSLMLLETEVPDPGIGDARDPMWRLIRRAVVAYDELEVGEGLAEHGFHGAIQGARPG
jgi:hypothetical protein